MKRALQASQKNRPSKGTQQGRCLSIEQMEPRRMMFATVDPWGTIGLSYSYSNLLDNATGWATGLDRVDMQNATEEAMGIWTAVTPLRLFARADSGPAPSDTPYAAGSHPTFRWGHHFIDGAVGQNALAHAAYPGATGLAGDPHYDDGNTWTINKLLYTGAHEFGHALGMAHANGDVSGDPPTCPPYVPAVMDACTGGVTYNGLESAYLLPDDIAGIRSLYGTGLGYVLGPFGELNVYGTGGDDILAVEVSGGNITVASAPVGGALRGSFTRPLNDGLTTINTIYLHGLGGNDILRAETTSGLPINLAGGDGNDFFDFGFNSNNLSNIGSAQIFAGAGIDRVFVYDNLNSGGETYTVTGTRIDRPSWGGLRYFDDLEGLTLTTGNTANTVNVLGTSANAPLVVASAGGADTVNIGGASIGAQFIESDVQIQNDPSVTTLNIDDFSNSTARTATYDVSGGFGYVAGLAPGTIYWDINDIGSINVVNGGSSDTNNIIRNSELLNFNTSGGSDIFKIGSPSASGVQGITGQITIDNSPSTSLVTIDDSGDSALRTVSIDESLGYNMISGLAPAVIRFDSADVSEATVVTGSAWDSVNIRRSDEDLIVTSSGGNDFVNLGNVSTGVQEITRHLSIRNPFGTSFLSIDDGGDTIARTIEIDAFFGLQWIDGLAPGRIEWGIVDLSPTFPVLITLGSGGDNLSVLNSWVPLQVSTTGGFDTASVGNDIRGCSGIFANVSFQNPPSRTRLTVNDSGRAGGRAWTVDSSGGYGRLVMDTNVEISYRLNDMSNPVTMNLGNGNDEVRVNGLETIALDVNGNNGNDLVHAGGSLGATALITAPLTFRGGIGEDRFVAHGDSFNLAPEATFDGGDGFDTFTNNDQTTDRGWGYTVYGDGTPSVSRYNDAASVLSIVNLPNVDEYLINAGDNFDGLSLVGVDPNVVVRFFGGGESDSLNAVPATVRGAVHFDGQTGNDSITLVTDNAGKTVHLLQNSLGAVSGDDFWGPGGGLYFSNVSNINLFLGTGADTVFAQPNISAVIQLDGNQPTTSPGDRLELLLGGVVNPLVTSSGPGNGTVTGGNVAALSYNSFETVASSDSDFNHDGLLNATDIDALMAQIALHTNNPEYDLTQDGLVNLADRDAWLAFAGGTNLGPGLAYRLGDATLDGVVDGSDFGRWNANKFTSVAAWSKGDFSGDGVIDGSDFGIWNSNKFTSSFGTSYTDWTSVDLGNEIATGILNGSTVTFSGTDINFGVTNGTSSFFNYPGVFTPSIPNTDCVQFVSGVGSPHNYTLSFNSPVTNPTLHLQSLGSILTFTSPSSFTLVKLSGDASFVVSGNTVTGSLISGPPVNSDSNGSVLFQGTFSQISFTSLALPGASADGVNFQISTGSGPFNGRPVNVNQIGNGIVGTAAKEDIFYDEDVYDGLQIDLLAEAIAARTSEQPAVPLVLIPIPSARDDRDSTSPKDRSARSEASHDTIDLATATQSRSLITDPGNARRGKLTRRLEVWPGEDFYFDNVPWTAVERVPGDVLDHLCT